MERESLHNEAKESLQDVSFALQSSSILLQPEGFRLDEYLVQLVFQLLVEGCDEPVYVAAALPRGYMAVLPKDDAFTLPSNFTIYETLHTCLVNISPAYHTQFHQQLESKLASLAAKCNDDEEDEDDCDGEDNGDGGGRREARDGDESDDDQLNEVNDALADFY